MNWIPVTDHLPEEHQEVLVTDGVKVEKDKYEWCLLHSSSDPDYERWGYSFTLYGREMNITHWCEITLPEERLEADDLLGAGHPYINRTDWK